MTYLLLCRTRTRSYGGGYACVWWGPHRHGYTSEVSSAGRYDLEEAEAIAEAADDVEIVPVAIALPHIQQVIPASRIGAIRTRVQAEVEAGADG